MSTTDFAGLPITGVIRYQDTSTPQRPVEEFHGLLLEVLGNEDVKAVYWTQYTPYFNDGEPCEFGIGEVTITFHSYPDPEHNGPYERGYGGRSPQVMGGYEKQYDSTERRWVQVGEELPRHPVCEIFNEFVHCFPAHEVSLLKAFGDHAEVRVTSAGIQVDVLDHE